jgi:hypothetical protein
MESAEQVIILPPRAAAAAAELRDLEEMLGTLVQEAVIIALARRYLL